MKIKVENDDKDEESRMKLQRNRIMRERWSREFGLVSENLGSSEEGDEDFALKKWGRKIEAWLTSRIPIL